MFTFRTYHNGLLMYMDSLPRESDQMLGTYFILNLVDGVLETEVLMLSTFMMNTERIGENLNDNENHTVSVLLDVVNTELTVTLDGSSITVSYDHGDLTDQNIGTSGLYFGGVPDIHTVFLSGAENFEHYDGCIMGIRYSNETIGLMPETPIAENAVTEGCIVIDPCDGVECGAGVCVSPHGICDCRRTGMLGASCTEGKVFYLGL